VGTDWLRDPVLEVLGIEHGFGVRGLAAPAGTLFPVQVHGRRVLDAASAAPATEGGADREADAILASGPGRRVGIVTADCVPILAAARDGGAVVAIHAGWRGLAAGVIEAGIEALRTRSPNGGEVAAVGPAARGCCYEVDAPVAEALAARYASLLPGVLVPGRPGHHRLDLSGLAARVLAGLGLSADRIGRTCMHCTICAPERFESHRRDGAAAGRLRHFVGTSGSTVVQG